MKEEEIKIFMRPDKRRGLIDIQKMFQFKIHKDTRQVYDSISKKVGSLGWDLSERKERHKFQLSEQEK